MRIGLIAPPWLPVPPAGYGGIEAIIDSLARGLITAGHEVLLAAPAGSSCPVSMVDGMAPPVDNPDLIGNAIVELRHVAAAYEALSDVDLIHDHTVTGPFYRARPSGRPPLVTTNHGPFASLLGELYRRLDDEVSIIAISRHQASTAHGVRIRRVIHHGLEIDAIPLGAGDGGYICFLGRMCPDKGPVEAALIARLAGIPLKIAAKMRETAEREYFDACLAPLLCSDVEYVGELAAHDKYALLGGATALVNPIQWPEPFGLVMVEALATGTPVVATACASAPEIVDDGVTGFLRNSLSELPAALHAAGGLDRSACRKAAAERFSAQRMVQEHLGLYSELIAQPRQQSTFLDRVAASTAVRGAV
jgi:glycosyltransferase involved in cell wall biosynthesis